MVPALDICLVFEVFGKYPVQDAPHFKDYLCRIIPSHLLNPIDPEGLSSSKRRKARETLVEDILLLRYVLMNSPDPRAFGSGLSFTIFMISTVLPRGCWDLIWQHDKCRWDHLRWNMQLREYCQNLFFSLESDLTPPESVSDAWWELPQDEWFDAPALYRELLSAYTSHTCGRCNERNHEFDNEYAEYHLSDPGAGRCFHGYMIRLLRVLLRHSHRQIREKLLLVPGSILPFELRLPTELADIITEQAFQVESIPGDSEVMLKSITNQQEREDFWAIDTRLKPQYRCPNMVALPTYYGQQSFNTLILPPDAFYHKEPQDSDPDRFNLYAMAFDPDDVDYEEERD